MSGIIFGSELRKNRSMEVGKVLKIGDFSKLSRVSVRMLRYYDDIGLLKPTKIDEFSGYRYYSENQLFVIGRISALKDMGFALADIIEMLAVYDDKDKIDEFLRVKQEELKKESEQTEYRLMLLDSARKRLRKEEIMNFDVNVKTIPERYAATCRMVIPRYEDEGLLWNVLCEYETPLIPADPCLAAAVFMDREFKEENVEVMIWMTVKGAYADSEKVKFKTLPEVKAATCILKGSYEGINDATATVISWIKENGYTVNGPMFNIYHVGPAQTQNPEEFVTEVCFPIE
jgi:DNA-binding transcriptional MerR regulator